MAHRCIREREPLLQPDATASDGTAMAQAARGTIARPGTVIANVMLHHHRAERESKKKKNLSLYPLSFHGSLAHFRVRASLMVCVASSDRFTIGSSDHVVVGPVFRTDDLMQVFRGAVIPSVTGRSRSPPPPSPRAGECHYCFPDSLWCVPDSASSRWETAAGLRPLSGSGRWTTTVLIMSLNTAAWHHFLYVYVHHFRQRVG